ncbi:MAG: DUF2914 domain-containing protein [Planctomycetota bacterium]|jgi:cytoskeletal protein RodZ
MQTVGDYLKREREARNISLRDVSRLTKIAEWYLDCLEKDDYEKIPQGPYIKGYISSYATLIGINADEALKRYNSPHWERDKTNDIPHEIPEDKNRQKSIAFLLNKRSWLLVGITILILSTFGFYHLFSQRFKPIETERQTNPQTQVPPRMEGLPLSPSEPSVEASRQTPSPLETIIHSQSASIIEHPILETLPPLEQHSSDQIALGEDVGGRLLQIQTLTSPSVGSSSQDQSEESRAHQQNNMNVLKATACTDIQNMNPYGADDSFHWSTERVYIWTLLKCERPPSSIRHIYYFKGQKVSEVSLEIRSPRWRTWSYKTLLNKRFIGPWRVDLTSAEGKLIQSIHFEVN